MSAREELLGRVRAALGPAPARPEVPRAYHRRGALDPGDPALVELLIDRLVDYRATVIRPGSDVAAALREVLPPGRVLHAPGLPEPWRPEGSEADDGTAVPRELDEVAAAVTGSVIAIASTGTIVLDGSPLCGRRALTLVPDVHLCIVRREDVVETVPEGLERLDPSRPLTFVSGPSATSDIELNRVEGVHGPRTLVVAIV